MNKDNKSNQEKLIDARIALIDKRIKNIDDSIKTIDNSILAIDVFLYSCAIIIILFFAAIFILA